MAETTITNERARSLLCDLISLRSVNPMGRPYDGASPVERPVTEYLERLFGPHGVAMRRQQCSPIHESLIVEIPGASDGPATLLESHMDTVPADDWADRAFAPRVERDWIVFGRGAADDKGCLAAMALAVLDLLERQVRPPLPVVFVAAGDEEYAQTGIRQYAATCNTPIGRGVFGEPTKLLPVIQHKGTTRWDIVVHGRSAHTSQPDLGHNAVLDAVKVIHKLGELQSHYRARYKSDMMTGPTITVTRIDGGRTRNAVPDECTLWVDLRTLPDMDERRTRQEIIDALSTFDVKLTHRDTQVLSPALRTMADDPFVREVTGLCGREIGKAVQPSAVPYGTDAAYVPHGAPAIVLGPGSIDTAHAIDEHVDAREVAACARIYRDITTTAWKAAVNRQ